MQMIPGSEKVTESKRLSGFKAYSEFSINVKLLILLTFAGGIGGGMTWFMLSLYMQSVGFSLQNIGWVGGIGGLATTLTYLVTPFIANTIGKKNTLYLGYGFVVLSTALLLIMVNLPLYIFSSIIGGIGSALAGPTFITVFSNLCTRKISKYAFSLQSFSQQIGMAMGTVLGGLLPSGFVQIFSFPIAQGFWWSLLVSIILNTLQLVILLFTRVENGIKVAHFSLKIREPALIGKFAVTNLLVGLGAGLVIPWFPIFFTNKYFLPNYSDFNQAYAVALPLVSTIMTISSVIMSFSFLVAPFFAERFGQVKLIAGSQALSVLFLFLIPFSPNFPVAAFLYIVRTILMMVSSPIATSFMMNVVKVEDKTSANSITMFAWNAAWSLSYFSAGYLWAIFPDYIPFVLCSVFYLSSSLLYFAFFSKIEKP